MALKVYKPTSPGRRGMTAIQGEKLTKKKPEKALTAFHLRTGGRNNDGRQTIRFRGGGHKRLYRQIDFRRDKVGIPAKVAAIEYDPNRSSRIALARLTLATPVRVINRVHDDATNMRTLALPSRTPGS